MDDEPSPDQRELDREIESMRGFESLGLRPSDYADWADDGISGVRSERLAASGVGHLAGESLAVALREMESTALARAFGLSTDSAELDPSLPDRAFRRATTGSNVRNWTRLMIDTEREVFAALAEDGVQTGRLEVEWEGPGAPVTVLRAREWAPWRLDEIHRAIDREAAARRGSYRECDRCARLVAPEHLTTEESRTLCHACMEQLGTVY